MPDKLELQSEVIESPISLAPRASLPAEVAQLLRTQIRSGKFQSGERLVETRIARQLGIGQPTVREGLKTLEGEGLVVQRPFRGYSVTTLSADQVNQVFDLRKVLEVHAIELSLKNRAKWKPDSLLQVLSQMKRAARDRDVETYYCQDLEFHETLWRLSGNPFLVRALTQVVVPLFAFCMIRRLRELDMDLVANANDHESIVRAIVGGSAQNARRVGRQTLDKFWKLTRNLSDRRYPESRAANSVPSKGSG